MPSLIDLRRRIRAVKNTQQITKAMKTVSASKLRKAQERMMGARPYAGEMKRVLTGLAARADSSVAPAAGRAGGDSDAPDPTLRGHRGQGPVWRLQLVAAAERTRPICGTVMTTVALGLIGRRGRDFFRRHSVDVRYEDINIFNDLRYGHARAIAESAIRQFTAGEVSRVSILYNEFKSVMQQDVVVEPVLADPASRARRGGPSRTLAEYLFEPEPAEIFSTLLPRYVETQVFRALLESAAAEHAARMTAMDAATRNAGEMIDALTLHMNKVRQATITRELIEVVSGAQAL